MSSLNKSDPQGFQINFELSIFLFLSTTYTMDNALGSQMFVFDQIKGRVNFK
jgi:hypothetical protein